jgi:sugar diacid utilization regulator
MTIEELMKLYPSGKIQPEPSIDGQLSLPINGQYFIIPDDVIQETELYLLKKIFFSDEPSESIKNHPWYDYLFDHILLEATGLFRIIQFQIKKPKAFLQIEWETSIKEIFSNFVDFFFINELEGFLIEKFSNDQYSLEEMESIFLTLDADFDSSTKVFIGSYFAANEQLPVLFQEERKIFIEESEQLRGKSAFSLSDVALHYFTKESMKNSQVIQAISKQLVFTADFKQIILSLWQHQGNISSTAKDLYMHRNTLHYRLDKFYEQTGLSLKKMDDLMFCYLLITK